jgi:Fur family peroxide stress response transcriptional regulator
MRKHPLYRRSRQRERILELLKSVDIHPTANWLYGKLRKEFPELSMGTVYRNIGILIKQGHIGRITFGSTFDRLDANTQPHYHFVCESCDAIIDLDIPIDESLNGWISKSQGFLVRKHDLEFRGLCPKCAKKA